MKCNLYHSHVVLFFFFVQTLLVLIDVEFPFKISF